MKRLLLLAPVAALTLAACGSTTERTASPSADPERTSAPGSSVAGHGWVGGEPDWSSVEPTGAAGGSDTKALGAGDASRAPEIAPRPASVVAAATTIVGAAGDGGADRAPLRAGSVDDNADFAGYLTYLDRYRSLGLPARAFDPTGRIVVSLTSVNGLPAMGVPVVITAGGRSVTTLRTGVDGRAIFLPATYGDVQAGYHLAASGAEVDTVPGNDVSLNTTSSTPAATATTASAGVDGVALPVDVLFLLDVTGSMGDEIDQLKATITDVSTRLENLPGHPDIRFGMTLFRDEGDSFVTSTFDFTGDIAAFAAALDEVRADGGGDTPEAVDEAFAAALAEPDWRDPATTASMIFLVGDAAPHVERDLQQAYPQSIHVAESRGITVHVVAASATDDPAEHAFRAIAEGTGGRFVFLAYGAGGAAVGEHTDIASTDYEEMSLDDLVVRLVSESLARLTGIPADRRETSTTTTVVPPTNPPGQ